MQRSHFSVSLSLNACGYVTQRQSHSKPCSVSCDLSRIARTMDGRRTAALLLVLLQQAPCAGKSDSPTSAPGGLLAYWVLHRGVYRHME